MGKSSAPILKGAGFSSGCLSGPRRAVGGYRNASSRGFKNGMLFGKYLNTKKHPFGTLVVVFLLAFVFCDFFGKA